MSHPSFNDRWIIPYEIPAFLPTENATRFVSKFFETLCNLLGLKHFKATAYHPQTNGLAERYKKTLIGILRCHVAEHQSDWDNFVQPHAYTYNTQISSSNGTTLFHLKLSRHQSGLKAFDNPSASTTDAKQVNVPSKQEAWLLHRITRMRKESDVKLAAVLL